MKATLLPDASEIARRLRHYQSGERVRILRGKLAGREMTVMHSTHGWVMLAEIPQRDAMSKLNIEPTQGFSQEEMCQAERTLKAMRESI